jgi:hypothetical protein
MGRKRSVHISEPTLLLSLPSAPFCLLLFFPGRFVHIPIYATLLLSQFVNYNLVTRTQSMPLQPACALISENVKNARSILKADGTVF